MAKKVSAVTTPAKPRQYRRPRPALLDVARDIAAGKSIGPIWPKYEDAAEEEARRRAFFQIDLGVGSEEYDRLTSLQKLAMEERWTEKHLKTVAPAIEQPKQRRGRPSNEERRKIIRQAKGLPTAAYVDYISKPLPPPDSWQEKGKPKLTYLQMYEHPNGQKRKNFRKSILDERGYYVRKK